MRFAFVIVVMVFSLNLSVSIADTSNRQFVKLPEHMRSHMLASMRDHLMTIHKIQSALAKGEYDKASDLAESHLGMSSLEAHNASHMAPFMPKGMQEIGTQMHHAASRFSRVVQEVAVSGKLADALDSLSNVTQQCVSCHASYRVH